jgi:hypothetical protein
MNTALNVTIVALILSGCARGMLKTDEISATQTIEQFVEQRFRSMELPALPFLEQQPKHQLTSGEALHDAYFTRLNPSQLAVPVQNLRVFCEARGGKFSQIEASRISVSKLASPALSKNDVFYGRRAAYSYLGFDANLAAITAAYDAEYYQRFVDAFYPQSVRDTLASAQRAGAFGKYGCERTDHPIWIVAVEPTKYNPPSDPNNALMSPSMTLYIKATALVP